MTDKNGGIVVFKKSDAVGPAGPILINSRGQTTQQVNRAPKCDLVFTIDTTGSMDDKIERLLQNCQQLVDKLAKQQVDPRIAIVAFGDLTVHGDKIVVTQFMNNLDTVKRSLVHIPHFSGGGNNGESSLEAMDKTLGLGTFRPDAIKVCILLTDEPAITRTFTPDAIIKRLKQAGMLTFVISEPQAYFKQMASETGGKWFQISSHVNFLSILDQLFKQVTQTVVDVQTLAGGDVQKYLELKSGK